MTLEEYNIEHLSPAAVERALKEMFRISRTEVIVHLFNGKWDGGHGIVPGRRYYRNQVSVAKIAARFRRPGARVRCLRMAEWLHNKFGFRAHHNPNAFSMILDRQVELAK